VVLRADPLNYSIGSFDDEKTIDRMSSGFTLLCESYVMFEVGAAPDFLGDGGVRTPLSALVKRRKRDRYEIWVKPPPGYKWFTPNQVGAV
jgi:hypothetical protein